MDTRRLLRTALAATCLAAAAAQQQPAPRQESLAHRILRMGEPEQIEYINSVLDQGLQVDNTDPLIVLISTRSSLVLPMMERKIEEVMKSSSPLDLFTDKTIDPQRFVDVAASNIAYAGDEQALREASKLLALDEKRFDLLVRNTLLSASVRRNPFAVAYRGFEIGDPAVDKRILAWIWPQLAANTESRLIELKHWWAEAMAEKYGAAPTEVNWANDPIASRIDPALAASLHDEVLRLGAEAFEKHSKN